MPGAPRWLVVYLCLFTLSAEGARGLGSPGEALSASEGEHARSLLFAVAGRGAPILSAVEVQRLLPEDGTLLLEVLLGERESALWLVSRREVARFPLPPRERIESLARRVAALLPESRGRRARRAARRAAEELSRLVLGPVAGRLGGRRLVFVPDGALAQVPWAALPDPAAEPAPAGAIWPEPLLLRHEVAVVPSTSVLAALAARSLGRSSPPGVLAFVGDAVTDPADPRLPLPFALARPLRSFLPRLPGAAEEAAALAGMVPAGRLLLAEGFAAARDRVLAGDLAGYRLLHFSVHGLLAPPALVLSRWDREARRRPCLLRAGDLAGLHLPAQLVTLAACDTAREPRGTGGNGLVQGFFAAGASRVLAGLWSVADTSTAALMVRFYRGLLHEGRAPGEALRAAQLAIWRQARFAAPFHWAGFLLQGAPW